MEKLFLIKANIPVLTAIKKIETGEIELIDVYGESIGYYATEDVYDFVKGNISIFDSKCCLLKYSMFPRCIRPTEEQIINFLNYKK